MVACLIHLRHHMHACIGSNTLTWRVLLQLTVELLYLTVQAFLFSLILYFAAGFARNAGKFFW